MKIKQERSIHICLLSDTHELHNELDVPSAEILVHCGDFSMFSRNMLAIKDFNRWLGELPHRHRIVIPGNHEFFLENDPSRRSMLSNAIVLINEGIEIEGLHIWGSPVTGRDGGAFGIGSPEKRRKLYAQIPKNTDILITHGAPYGVLDSAPGSGFHSGCRELFDAVTSIRPKLHAFGDVHGSYGIFHTDHTTFVNAALLGPDGGIDKAPIVLRMERK